MSQTTLEILGFIQWQAMQPRETNRGKVKQVITGIPGPMFWKRYKGNNGRAILRELNATIGNLGKGSWEVVVWLNRHNEHLAEKLGFAKPEAIAVDTSIPAGESPF